MLRSLFLLCTFLCAHSFGLCDLLQHVYPENIFTEAELLAQFSPAKIVSIEAPPVGAAVLIVELEGGMRYVVRQPTQLDHLDFERFASELVRQAPGTQTPLVQTLGKAETRLALERMNALKPNLSFGKQAEELNVAVYYPMQRGKEYLNSGKKRDANLTVARNVLMAYAIDGDAKNHSGAWARLWSRLDVESKRALLEELQQSSPGLSTLTMGNAGTKVAELMGNSPGFLAPLLQAEIAKVPAKVRQQLADHWILYTILGIPDFHHNNWLIHHDVVLAIDLALKSPEFFMGSHSTSLRGQEMPLSWLNDSGKAGQKLILGWASPEMIAYMQGLDADKLRAVAAKANYTLTEDNLSGVLARAKRLSKLRD